MLRKFRRRFILITMVLVGIVSLAAFAVIGVNNYRETRGDVDRALEIAVENNTLESIMPSFGGKGRNGKDGGRFQTVPILSVTIYFDNPSYIITDANSTATIDDSATLQEVVTAALASGQETGRLSGYDLYFKVASDGVCQKIAFANATSVDQKIVESIGGLLGIWAILMLAFLGVTILLSRFATRPVERAWKDQQRFIADASHELKTPLTIIMADAAILAENPNKTVAEQNMWVEGISAEATRMQRLTEDMLTLAQADAGVDMKQMMGALDFSSVVEGQILQFDAVAFERGLIIEGEVQEDLRVIGDEMCLENTVKTIIENACKYSAQPGTIAVKLAAAKNHAVLAVHNEGDPIPAEDLPHLFDRFYRSDKARVHEGEAASFGLGLSIAKSTVELHGGTIGVASDTSGTTFTIKIPLMK